MNNNAATTAWIVDYSQHNLELRSVSRNHERWGGAGLISISRFTTIFANFRGYKCWKIKIDEKKDEAGFISHLKIDEKCEMHVILW